MAIELPAQPGTRHLKIEPLDFGFVQRGADGAATTRIDRPGNRFRVTASWPFMKPAEASVFQVRLERARGQPLRLVMPLLGETQGAPGSPVVDGTDSGGTTLKLKTASPGYVVKEGYWLTLVHAGVYHLHRAAAVAVVGADGKATLTVEPPLRVFPANGDAVLLARPMIEGLVTALEPYEHPVNRRIQLTATIEESA